MSTASSSAILADALAVLSKTTHQILADAETRSRSEVARATVDANEARHQRDDAMKKAHALQLEVEALRRENTAAKASHAQAELRVAHELDTLNQNAEIIAQLRREVNQWKDQSKNWQEHFLRVEQERCALSSRIDELVSERLQLFRNPSAVHTPLSRYQESHGGPSGSNKREQSSPMKSSALKVPLPLSDGEDPSPNTTGSTSKDSRTKPRRPPGSSAKKRGPHTPANVDSPLAHVKASSSQSRNADQTRTANHQPTIRSSTVIRRVQAVVQVKREESDEDTDPNSEQHPPQPQQSTGEPRVRRKRSRLIVEDPQDEESDDGATVARSLRTAKSINYEESDFEDQESDEDELMIRNEDKREGANRSKPTNGPPTKKRKKVS